LLCQDFIHFYETKIIDAYCSFRTSNEQMTGSRDFGIDNAKIYKKWRHTATLENLQQVIERQNSVLKQRGIDPKSFGL